MSREETTVWHNNCLSRICQIIIETIIGGAVVKDILVFGTGEAGKEAVRLLERRHHILFAVDNDSTKWGRDRKSVV